MIQNKGYKIWTDDVEPSAMAQIINVSQLPFLFKHMAVMPDVHMGYGMPIGGVLATENVIIPNAVGVDIGCGMAFAETIIEAASLNVSECIADIMGKIPVGFKHRDRGYVIPTPPEEEMNIELHHACFPAAEYQMGTLGGGNHFIELQVNEAGRLCVMIHSGSRNIGKQVCDYYNRMAKELNAKWYSRVPEEFDLAFLPVDHVTGQEYLEYMNYCVRFAKMNRETMMKIVLNTILGTDADILDCKHNFARQENHFGKNVWVHRKGAVHASGKVIIPGAMGSYSYICEGLENPMSFNSCSHGAGRIMSRKKAKETLRVGELDFVLGKHDLSDAAEEVKEAYKDIDAVLANEQDLVKPIMKLKTLGVVKG